jgi:uncharacterized membrane-anchored protein
MYTTHTRAMSHFLPANDPLRVSLHNEVHSRPSARIHLPALITYVAVLNTDVTREQEWAHIQRLPNQSNLPIEEMHGNFLRLRFEGYTIKWERHTEFTRYSIVQPLPAHAQLGQAQPDLLKDLVVSPEWLSSIPGQTVAAIQIGMVTDSFEDTSHLMALGQTWLGGRNTVASQLGVSPGQSHGHSWALTQFLIGPDGFERFLVISKHDASPTRAGRVSQRLLELETYRLMALRGLPVAKSLAPMLAEAETALANITIALEDKASSDQELLDTLVSLAAKVERGIAQHNYRFSATRAYNTLVGQRITELREKAIPGTQTLGEFMQRRLSPAIASVAAHAERLTSLSERVSRTSALLRTRVDIATEIQNQELLAKLTRGQALQLQLQTTVEGLSIAAISYYVISLLLYGSKALHSLGLPVNPEIMTGSLVPVVLWAVWAITRRLHAKMNLTDTSN